MEVGCRVETEDMRTGTRRYMTKAYLTFVAVDEDGRPRPLPPLDARDRRRSAPSPRGRRPSQGAGSSPRVGRHRHERCCHRRSHRMGPPARHRRRPRAVPPGPDHDQRRAARRWRARLGRDPEPEGPRALGDRRRARRRGVPDRVRARARGEDPRAARALRGDGRRHVRADHRSGAPDAGRTRSTSGARRSSRARTTHSRDDREPQVERLRIRARASCATASTSTRTTSRSRRRSSSSSTTARAATSARSRCSASTRRATRRAMLRGLVIEGTDPVAHGAPIKHAAKDNAGAVTSSRDRRRAPRSRSATCTAPRGTSAAPSRSPAGARPCTSYRGEPDRAGPRPGARVDPGDGGGCSLITDSFVTNEFSGDPFPIQVETDERRRDASGCASAARSIARPCSTCCRRSRIVDPRPERASRR